MNSTSPFDLRRRLQAGEVLHGAMMPSDTPMLVEICGLAGFDFVFLDTEHGALLHPSYGSLITAAESVGMASVIRVGRDVPLEVSRALDAGAQGVHVPFVEQAAQAQTIVQAARFYPEGQRGLGPVRANRYGTEGYAAFVERANRETLVVAAIESPAGVAEIDAIAAVPGVDVIFIAPADLSVMLGRPGGFDHPEVQAAVSNALHAARATGKIVGSLAVSPEHARQLAEQGVQYILMVLTSVFIRGARDWLAAARDV